MTSSACRGALVSLAFGCAAPDLPAATLDCESAIDAVAVPPAEYTVVLEAVALALGEHRVADHDDALYAKTGLLVRAGTASHVVVPASERGHVAVAWGSAARTWDLAVPACEGDEAWMVFAGGLYVDAPRCVELVVRLDLDEERVEVGAGAPCGR